MTVRNVKKNLAGQQDLLPGIGPYNQVRRGIEVVVDGPAKSFIELWSRSLYEANIDYVGTFEDGCTVQPGEAVVSLTKGRAFKLLGTETVTIVKDSSPESSGGIYPTGIWEDIANSSLRDNLRKSSGASNVYYSPGLANSSAVPLSSFLPKTSPISYGAKFNGVDDDTDGINKAIAAKGPGKYCSIQLPEGADVKILGTVLVPSGVKVHWNGSILVGSGTNVMFEGGKWSGSTIVSSFNDAPEASLTVDAEIGGGLAQNCSSVVRINNWVAGCRVYNIRGYQVNQLLHQKRSFYCEFINLLAWEPLNSSALPCFVWDGAIQAMGVRRCFAVGYLKGHVVRGPGDMDSFDCCGAEGCVEGLYLTGNAALGGGTSGLNVENWYFENNATAIKADPAYTYEKLVIDKCFFNENFVLLDGPTVLSGKFGKNSKIKTSVAKPGNINMLGNLAGRDGFDIELDEISDTANRTSATIDTAGRFFVGPNVRIQRIVTLTDSSGVPYARNIERPNLPIVKITGRQFGTIPTNTIPFCETYYAAPTLNVKTQVPFEDFAMVSYNIRVVDTTGGPYWVRGIVMGDQAFPLSVGQKTVTTQNNAGMLQLNISVFSGAATYAGIVKQL
jgi:hypothetical protein